MLGGAENTWRAIPSPGGMTSPNSVARIRDHLGDRVALEYALECAALGAVDRHASIGRIVGTAPR